jgi:hypothetical protein
MNFALTVLTLGAWFLMSQKLPTWKSFLNLKSWFPSPLAYLWDAWAGCVFCGGFWIAMLLRLSTGLTTIPELQGLHPLLAVSLDALATATIASLTVSLTGPMALLLNAARAKQETDHRRTAATQDVPMNAKSAPATT